MSPPKVDGKFLEVSGRRFSVKGVSYGTFAAGPRGTFLPDHDVIEADFARMAQAGLNAVRLYTPPDAEVLDAAGEAGLRVMVGFPWAQHVAFLSNRRMCRDIRHGLAARLRTIGRHPAVLLFALGNEIPPDVVRWHGRRNVERFLREMYEDAKSVVPDGLFTYVNFPPTEYLDTSFFDLCAFNIYLHDRGAFAAYLARLQHIAGHKPLLITELGADSLRQSEEGQAALVSMQLRVAFAAGACGAVAFSWTDEWWRGGQKVDDWAFGLVTEGREPKAALGSATRAFAAVPFKDQAAHWPMVSVVVCGYNVADTIGECLTSIERLNYPNYEVIVVNDGSTDATGAIAGGYRSVTVIETPNSGLAAARNLGLAEARGEIVAYTDADVRVDPDWLAFLVQPLLATDVVGSGGPNVVPDDDGWVAQCVARAPGGPTHVLLDDSTAEHVPGCNMAFRREALLAVGGFDPTFVRAGDDVDMCWRLHARGWRIGFAPSALVWHRHRATVMAYCRQQAGYGEGETWLMRRHPEKFIRGRILWAGHIYSPLPIIRSMWQAQISSGPFGRTAFPSVYRRSASPWSYVPHSEVWILAATSMAAGGAAARAMGASGALWWLALGIAALLFTAGRCIAHSVRSDIRQLRPIGPAGPRQSRVMYRGVIAYLHFIQPLARSYGRIRGWYHSPLDRLGGLPRMGGWTQHDLRASLSVWRWFAGRSIHLQSWSEQGIDPDEFCGRLVRHLRDQRFVRSIAIDDGWLEDVDLNIEVGWALRATVRILVEDHGALGSLCRVAVRARLRGRCGAAAGLALAAFAMSGATVTAPGLAVAASVVIAGVAVAMGRSLEAFRRAYLAASSELKIVTVHRREADTAPATARTGFGSLLIRHVASALPARPVRPVLVDRAPLRAARLLARIRDWGTRQ